MNIEKIGNKSKSERYKMYRDFYRNFMDAEVSVGDFCKTEGVERSIGRSMIDAGKIIDENNLYYE